jgi:transketolase
MTPQKNLELQKLALRVREHILRMSTHGGCFTGASLSCADIFVYLYASGEFRLSPDKVNDPERDRVFLSKGHDVPALYATLAELGYFPLERLKNHLKTNDHLYWHPNTNIPGVEFHSGSLGHLPSVALGVAMDLRLRGADNRVIVIVGDGELNEGSVWECLLVASAYKLGNFILVVDRNWFQANMRTEELIPLEPLEDKFRAFGCQVRRINGHDFFKLHQGFASLDHRGSVPTAIICDTLRGKGVKSIEERADRWFCNFTEKEVEQLILELRGEADARLSSETLTVR